MNECRHFLLLILIFIVPVGSQLHSQGHGSSYEDAFSSFDMAIGIENTGLFNGKEYIEKHVVRNQKHKFLFSPDYLRGTVLYDGLPYYDLAMKYNVYDDLLLVKVVYPEGERSFELHKSEVESFSVENKRFVNINSEAALESETKGFYEVLLERPRLRLLKKYTKKRKKLLDKDFTYYEFEEDDPKYVLEVHENFIAVSSKRPVIQQFPEHKKKIRQYYKNHANLLKENPDQFYVDLIRELSISVMNRTILK